MKSPPRPLQSFSILTIFLLLFSVTVIAQQSRGTWRGLITDEFGAVIVGATVTLTDARGTQKQTTTNKDGAYTFAALAFGSYQIKAVAIGFDPSEETPVVLNSARQSLDVMLKVALIVDKVTVTETPVSTEATNNANQTLIAGKDLDALPDDPDELAAALQALAGPSVGPNGGQIFIDGFPGGNVPSKDSIREIRINQNPFAAENDQPSARIDILTRPGTDKFRGGGSFNFNDESLNSRNPFAVTSSKRTPFQIRQYETNVSGPVVPRKASFFFNFSRIETDDNELVRASVLDDNLNVVDFGQAFLVPRRNMQLSPRFDYAINQNNTLIVRYNYNRFRAKTVEVVTNDERVVLIDRVIKTWTQLHIAPRHQKRLAEVDDVEIVVEHARAHELVIVRFDATEVKEERRHPRHDWTTDVRLVLANLKRRALARGDGKRVARVETFVVEIKRTTAAKLVRARTRQNVDTRRRLIVLRRKRILIDADLANRIFRRHGAAGEAVDKDLSAVWSN